MKQTSGFKIQSLIASEPPPPVLPTVTQLPTGEPEFELQFQTQQKSKHMIEIPEYGQFKVNFEAGNGFKILDRDATDGEAHIQVPTAVFDLYLRLKPPFNQKSKSAAKDPAHLQIQDPLYGLNQTVAPQAGEIWHHLSRRPFPIPASWGNATGLAYQLSFENKGNKGFMTQWFRQTGQPDLPQSVKIVPRIDCIQPNRDGTYTAFLGYDNHMPGTITIPVGHANQIQPAPLDRGQPTLFNPGNTSSYPQSVHAVNFEAALSWEINQRKVSLNSPDPSYFCETTQSTPVLKGAAVRKTFLANQSFSASTQAKHTASFSLDEASDLRRYALLSIQRDSADTQVSLAINQQAQELEFTANALEQLVDLTALKLGENTLDIQFTGSGSASLQIDGFLEPFFIPDALFSKIPHNDMVRGEEYVSGKLAIKFLEGMDIGLRDSGPLENRLYDKTGVSLAPLAQLLPQLGIQSIHPAIVISSDELNLTASDLNSFENELQNELGIEVANLNLFYTLTFDPNQDVWPIIDQLRALPFIEEAFPEFVGEEPVDTQGTPSEKVFKPQNQASDEQIYVNPNGNPKIRKDQWLRNTHVLRTGNQRGAWEYTPGHRDVKTAVIGGLALLAIEELGLPYATHEDFKDSTGKTIPEVVFTVDKDQIQSSFSHLNHETQAMAVMAAVPDNGKGIAGVAHHASNYLYVYRLDPKKNNEVKVVSEFCKNLASNETCWDLAATLFKAHLKGVRVALIEKAATSHTIESMDPLLQQVIAVVTNGISKSPQVSVRSKTFKNKTAVILPSGNNTCGHWQTKFNEAKTTADKQKYQKSLDECKARYLTYTPSKSPYIGNDIRKFECEDYWMHKWPPPLVTFTCKGNPLINTPDTGSIIVGGLKLDGSKRAGGFNVTTNSGTLNLPDYRWGKSDKLSLYPTPNGHGIDVSAPAEQIWTAAFNTTDKDKAYGAYGGTSGAAPIITGIVGLMFTVNPTLTPLEARRILKTTYNDNLDDIAGMVNAYEAVKQAAGGFSPEDFFLANPDFDKPGDGFGTLSLAEPPAGATPSDWGVEAFIQPGQIGQTRGGQLLGLFFNGQTNSFEIVIDGITVQTNITPTAASGSHFAQFRVPVGLSLGLKDLYIKSDTTEVKLENILNYTSPYPQTVILSKPTVIANGHDRADVEITMRDANGAPLSQEAHFLVTYSVPYLTPHNKVVLWNANGTALSSQNYMQTTHGKINLQIGYNWPVEPYEYGHDPVTNTFGHSWPHANAPSAQIRICEPQRCTSCAVGWTCKTQLFPQPGNTLEGRVFFKHGYQHEAKLYGVQPNAATIDVSVAVKDIEDQPLPAGMSLYLNQTNYGTVINENGTISSSPVVVTQGDGSIRFKYRPIQRSHLDQCDFAGVKENVLVYPTSSPFYGPGSSRSYLVGSPITFLYTGCN